MKSASKILLLSLLLSTWACVDSVSFPPIPHLEYKTHQLIGKDVDPTNTPFDHAEITLSFTDGDGNLGQDGSFNGIDCRGFDGSCNLFVNIYSKLNGSFDTNYTYDAIISDLTPTSQNPALEGDIIYKVSLANRLSDTVKLDFWMYDRDLNKSNIARTPEIYVDL